MTSRTVNRVVSHQAWIYASRLSSPVLLRQRCADPRCGHPFREHQGYLGCVHDPFCCCESFLIRKPI